MSSRSVARRYAEALLQLAEESGRLEETRSEFRQVFETVRQEEEVRRVLEHPLIPKGDKKELLKKIWGQNLSSHLLHFFHLLVDKQREGYLGDIFEEFDLLVDERLGIVRVKVTAAAPLTADVREALVHRLEEITGRKVRLEMTTNPDLLAGLMVQIGDRRIDGSLRTRLEQLQAAIRGESQEKGVTLG